MLPKALVVNLDCLGQEFDGRTNDELFTLTFPRSGEDAELQPPKFHEPQWLDDDDGDPRMWGWMPSTAGPAAVMGLAIWVDTTAVLNCSDARSRASYARDIFPVTFARWIGEVSTFLELWSGQGVRSVIPSKSEGPVVQLFDHKSDTGYTREAIEAAPTRKAGPMARLLSLADWKLAAQLVSDGSPPDVVWHMLNRAQKLALTETRFAVIEACTAVEVAVGRRVTDSLFGHPEEARDQILTNAGGILGLVRLHEKLFPRSQDQKRPDFSNTLASLRNEVAHAGKVPNDTEVGDALDTARRMLDEVCRLPSPSG